MSNPILCLDFDGVLHSYASGWQGAGNIPDPPVEGALEFLAEAIEHFDVAVLSSRSHQPGGRQAMFHWLKRHLWDRYGPADQSLINQIMDNVRFVEEKPPAFVTLDDRAITFTGEWPSLEELKAFRPWNKG